MDDQATQANDAKQPAPAAQVSVPSERSTEFTPVSGGPELTSAGTLLVVAYLAMWAVLMLLIWLGWRRQQRIDQRLNELSRVLGAGTLEATESPGAANAAGRPVPSKP